MAKAFKDDGPPGISDQDESGDENLTGSRNFIPDENPLQFLVKSTMPPNSQNTKPKNETIGQLFNKNISKNSTSNINQMLKNEISNKPKPISAEFSDYDEKSDSISALMQNVDNILGDKKPKPTINKKDQREESSISLILKGNLKNPPPPGFGNPSITNSPLSARSDTSKLGSKHFDTSSSLADRIKMRNKSNNQDDDQSETDAKSQSLGAFLKSVDNIIDPKPKEKNTENLLKINRPPSGFGNDQADEDGLSDLLEDEFKTKSNMFLMQPNKSTNSTPGIKDMLKDEFNKSGGNMFVNPNVPQKSASPTRSIKSLMSLNSKSPEPSNTPRLTDLVRKEFQTNTNEFFGTSVSSNKSEKSN